MRRTVVLTVFLASSLVLGGCQTPPPPPLAPLPAGPASGDDGTASPRINGDVIVRKPSPTVMEVSEGTRSTPRQPGFSSFEAAGGDGDVVLDFADTDVRAVVQQVLGQILKVDYAIDPAVHGTVSFKSAKPIARQAVLPTLEALLGQSGALLVRNGDLYRVIPAGQSYPAIGGEASSGTEIVSLRYTSAADLAKVLAPVVGQGNAGQGNGAPGAAGQQASRIIADPTHNALLITGDSAARTTIRSLIRSFDIDALAGRSYALFPVPAPEEPRRVAAQLREVFQTEGDGGLAGVVRIIPMDAADAVLVVAPEPRFIEDARRLFRLLDQTRETTARNWHVYYVQNGESSDLAHVLQQAFTPNNVTEQGSAASKGQKAVAPGQGLAQLNSGGSGSSGSNTSSNSSSGSSGFGSSGTSGTSGASGGGTGAGATGSGMSVGGGAASAATQSLSSNAEGGGDGSASADRIRIIANHVNNAILIYATPEEQSTIEAMLRRIDILPLQVRIDAAIAEVTLTDDLQYGTQFYLKHGGVNGLLTTASTSSTSLSGTYPGFVLTAKSGSAELVLSALSSVTNVRILSSPQIMVLDNQPARLLVGNLVPYLKETSQSTLTSTSSVVSSIDYRETGIILDVVPRVNKGGLVTLDLSQEVSAVQSTSSGNIESPTFTDRAVRSRIVVQDGQTVGLAGLISDTDSQENSGLPFLKDIPGLGFLFSTQTNSRTRTELLVLITPHVIEDQRAARALTEEMRRNLPDAALAPQQLGVQAPSGSSNPNASLLE
ncbi:type II secretion system secretin GspD [Telmatospirillum siberiense]|uniref:Type II secretion system protein GspD n=1 Tax=Telmatospirillum siberiense TaxID=382514 RepID=A0A2N3PQB0_9PROT|nr:type II secretion system secretin GspD [Telmatospirillum siberiense]PKU22589.1 type II secretion system protein GspD [Telmatospirillum siberiense]